MEVSVETLAHGTKVCISRAHRFGTDAMLLSGFARPRRAERAVDLCSGCGIVALRWHDLGHRGPCRAVEVDPEGTSLLEQALAEDTALAHITPVCADLNELRGDGLAHLVAANPPYFTGGFVSPKSARATARHEGGCTLEQVAAGKGEEDPKQQADIPEAMMVFCDLGPGRLDQLLNTMRRTEFPPVLLKAVLTPTNRTWDSRQLWQELRREHEAMRGGQETQ